MKRRKFITLLGGAAVGWPLAARAQQAERVRRIGVLMHLAADDPDGQSRVAAFLQGLQEAGWAVGRNVNVDVRWAAGEADRYRRYATEIVALTPDVILTSATPSIRAICRSVSLICFTEVTRVARSALAASGHATAAPPRSAMNSRRFTRSPHRQWQAPSAAR